MTNKGKGMSYPAAHEKAGAEGYLMPNKGVGFDHGNNLDYFELE